MTTDRDGFLHHVRQALRAGNRPGEAVGIPARDRIGYQGGGSDPVAPFREEFVKAGGFFHLLPDADSAAQKILELLAVGVPCFRGPATNPDTAQDVRGPRKHATRVLVGHGPLLDRLGLQSILKERGIEIMAADIPGPESFREPFFAAEVGISGVDFLVAETGTIVMHSRPDQPRSLGLLPPVYIAVAEPSQIVPDLFDLFEETSDGKPLFLPSCISLITGPSKTGDIELRLVTGVHGPGEVHLLLISA